VIVSRSAGTATFPARFQLVAAANPCRRGCPSLPTCACAPGERTRYLARLSRPLLDRIDLHLEIPTLPYAQFTEAAPGEPSAVIRARVLAARFAGTATHVNARMSGRQTRRHCPLPADAARPRPGPAAAPSARFLDREPVPVQEDSGPARDHHAHGPLSPTRTVRCRGSREAPGPSGTPAPQRKWR